MEEGLSPIGPDDTQMTGDFEGENIELSEISEDDKEIELTPETEEEIMEKVIDLKKGDFFVHQTKSDQISEILSGGLFSPKFAERLIKMGKETDFDRKRITTLKELSGGPAKFDGDKLVSLGKTWWEYSGDLIWLTDGKYYNDRNGHHDEPEWWFRSVRFGDAAIVLDKKLDGKQTGRDTGNTFAVRISPKWFVGLIVVPESHDTVVKSNNRNGKLPVYDASDNLIWPRHMSYEEVKQFVTERDARNEESRTDSETSSE